MGRVARRPQRITLKVLGLLMYSTFYTLPLSWKIAVPVGLSPRPFPTSPLFLRSICQLSVSPALFFNVKANTAFPCLTASLRSASEAVRASFITSKASEEGNASTVCQRLSGLARGGKVGVTVLERHYGRLKEGFSDFRWDL